MNLRFLSTVVAVSQTGSLAGAARALNLSQSTVSLRIKTLEDELEVRILDRSTRPPRLTDDGLAVLHYSEQLLALVGDLQAIGSEERLVGTVRMGVVPSTLPGLTPPALDHLLRENPDLSFEIVTGMSDHLLVEVEQRKLDFALVTQPGTLPDGLLESVVCEEPLDLVCSAGIDSTDTVRLLRTRPFIMFSRQTRTGRSIAAYLEKSGFHIQPVLEIDSIEAIEALVASGLGISISPRRTGFDYSAQPLVRIAIDRSEIVRRLVLVRPERSRRARVAETLHRHLTSIAAFRDQINTQENNP